MSRNILFINDYRASYVIPELLTGAGYAVEIVSGAAAGLQMLGERVFDIIIAMENPASESYVFCENIRKSTDTPLIVISPDAGTNTCVRAITAGADYFMRKPFGPLEFTARINSLLQRTSARQPAVILS
jgi:two-component system OmpR family response regulator